LPRKDLFEYYDSEQKTLVEINRFERSLEILGEYGIRVVPHQPFVFRTNYCLAEDKYGIGNITADVGSDGIDKGELARISNEGLLNLRSLINDILMWHIENGRLIPGDLKVSNFKVGVPYIKGRKIGDLGLYFMDLDPIYEEQGLQFPDTLDFYREIQEDIDQRILGDALYTN
jgi:hypothetical protein